MSSKWNKGLVSTAVHLYSAYKASIKGTYSALRTLKYKIRLHRYIIQALVFICDFLVRFDMCISIYMYMKFAVCML